MPSTSRSSVQCSEAQDSNVDNIKSSRRCIFCNLVEKKKGQRREYTSMCDSPDIINLTRQYAEENNDRALLAKLDSCTSFDYHPMCKRILKYKHEKVFEPPQISSSQWHEYRLAHKNAFESLTEFMENEIIKDEKIFYLNDLYLHYKSLLLEISGLKTNDFQNYYIGSLEEKLLEEHGDKIIICKSETYNNKKIVYKRNLDINKLINKTLVYENAEKKKFENIAYELRNAIRQMEKRKLPSNLDVDDILEGECDIPDLLFDFMCNLIQGPDTRRKNCDDDFIRIKSICHDIIYTVSKGRIKPAKHLTLGLALKSLTSSRKVLTILNRYGHTIGYTAAEELETEITYTSMNENQLIPSGIVIDETLSTHVAFDNYDRFVDTPSGKDTLHDTVGIIYQFVASDSNPRCASSSRRNLMNISNAESDVEGPLRKRRRFLEMPREIQPYYKKSPPKSNLIPLEEISSILESFTNFSTNSRLKNIIWAMSLSCIPSTPMWVGFYTGITIDDSQSQTVDYLPQINASPTSQSVVYETMLRAKSIAEKCGQNEIIVSYDLGIAKQAMAIQLNEKPTFDNVFVNLGAFHLEAAFFKAVGKYIDGSGIIDILVQAEVLAEGSANGIIDGKHFNRCKRIHPLLSGALQMLHFNQFFSTYNADNDILIEDLQYFKDNPSQETEYFELRPSLQVVVNDDDAYCKATLSGDHGKTAQFFMQYIFFIDLYLSLSRSIRTNNYKLYVSTIFQMINIFFAVNQQNYARWSLQYVCNIIQLKKIITSTSITISLHW